MPVFNARQQLQADVQEKVLGLGAIGKHPSRGLKENRRRFRVANSV